MKFVSVAMAAYNGEKYISKQIDSILSQLNDDDELVISYDDSSDNTLEIIKKYELENTNVRVVNDPQRGVFSNFENAIASCEGKYIFISDQDDIWIEGKKQTVIDDFITHNADMVIHNGYHIDESDKMISEDFFSMYSIKKGIIRNFVRPRYSGCCIAFTDTFKNIILPIPRKVGAYDHWIGMIGEKYGKVYFENKPLLKHRLHNSNVTVGTRPLHKILNARFNIFIELLKRKRV